MNNNAAANLPSTSILDFSLLTIATSNISTTATCNISTTRSAMVVHQPILSSSNLLSGLCLQNLGTSATQNPNSQNYLSLLVIPEDTTTNNLGSNQQQALTNNILSATVTNDELLMAIFLFDLEKMIKVPLFSEAALEEKPITTMYTDAKIDDHAIKLILDSGLAGSIITRQLMDQLADRVIKTPISEIDNLSIKINGITVLIKVFVIKTTQYQAFVGNNWLSKTNTVLDWTMQELQLSQNTICSHFKPTNLQPLIELKEKTKKPTWEAYQQKEKHTWETTIGTWIDDNQNKLLPTLSLEEKRKRKEREDNLPEKTESTKDTTSGWTTTATTTTHTTQMQRLWKKTLFHGSLGRTRQKSLDAVTDDYLGS
ncbi:hypothetical protein G9A89_001341 [Geosiphon pyriformis]|nr:hypothetical protein G9A89_001341 [Geosiphon pyriformis]